MTRFEEDLRQAARNKRHILAMACLTTLVFAALLASYFLSFRSLAIHVKPQHVEQLSLIDITDGMALTFGKRVYSLSEQIRLTVSAPKFQDAELTFSSADFGNEVTVLLLPKPGRLRANVTPSIPVNWYLDGAFSVHSDGLEAELAPGDYQISVRSDYHETVERTVSISADEELVLAIDLPVITGTLKADVTPAGTMTIDGTKVDYSKIITLGPGRHNIALSAPGYFAITDEIIIIETQRDFARSYNLRPKPIQIRHSLNPDGGILFVNGKRQNTAKGNLAVPYRNKIEIEYSKPGFTTMRQSQPVSPGEVVNLDIKLEPEFTDITVTANVPAEVYLDGQLLGPTPLKMMVPTIPATLEVRADGYDSKAKKISPTTTDPQMHDFVLVNAKLAKLRRSPKTYRNIAGVELQLIQPKKARYQMGGTRSERGQRANEFVRQIELQRPFYVATHELTERQFRGKGPNLPLVNTAWEKVALYCNEQSINEGLTPFYLTNNGRITGFDKQADGYRLISEAEWEFLARAYNRKKQTIFPWGDDAVVPPKIGNLAGDQAKPASSSYIAGYQDGISGIAPPKSFPADQAGLFDLVGNVSEWTNDAYSFGPPIGTEIEIDPLTRYAGGAHVIKGANFKSASRTELRAAFREGSDEPRDDVGFRLARYL